MNITRNKISWFGIALIIVGVAMLLNRLNIFNIAFSVIFWPLIMIGGLIAVAHGFSQNRQGKIYWGTVLFLYSLLFLLRSIDTIELYTNIFFASTFLIFGIGFFMLFLNNLKDWHFLIPAILLTGIGSLFIFTEYGCLSHRELLVVVRTYWPVVLILFGVVILLRK